LLGFGLNPVNQKAECGNARERHLLAWVIEGDNCRRRKDL
jgi:hypothetical protein